MKHVFVESNWVFNYCAPGHLRTPEAVDLAQRAANGDLTLHVPAICLREGEEAVRKKCQPRIAAQFREFRRWAVSEGLLTQTDADAANPLFDAFQRQFQQQLDTLSDRVSGLRSLPNVEVFALDDATFDRVLNLRGVPDLKPFDESILAAVLVRSSVVSSPGDEVYFCELDGDLAPVARKGTVRPALSQLYAQARITFRSDFLIP